MRRLTKILTVLVIGFLISGIVVRFIGPEDTTEAVTTLVPLTANLDQTPQPKSPASVSAAPDANPAPQPASPAPDVNPAPQPTSPTSASSQGGPWFPAVNMLAARSEFTATLICLVTIQYDEI